MFSQILLMDPLPFINKDFSLIIQEEKQREICVSLVSHDTSSALMTKSVLPKPSFLIHHELAAYITKTSLGLGFLSKTIRKNVPCVLIVE
jgi:hypothetical protein